MLSKLQEMSYLQYDNALAKIEEKNFTEALKYAEKAYEINNKDVDILNLCGLISLKLNYINKAKNYFYKSNKIDNNCLSSRYLELFVENGEMDRYESNYNEAINKLKNGDHKTAKELINECIKYNGEISDLYIIRAICWEWKGAKKLMKKNLLKALELDIGNEIAIRLIKECITDNKRNRVVEKKGKRTR